MNSALWHGSCARDECKWSKEYDKRRMWATSVTHMRPVNDCCTTHEPRPRIWKIRNKRYCIKRHIKHSHMSEDSRTNGDDENWRHKTTTTYYMNQFVNKRKNCLNASTQNDFLFSQYSKDTEEHHMNVRVRDIWELRIYICNHHGRCFHADFIVSHRANGKRYASDTRTQPVCSGHS